MEKLEERIIDLVDVISEPDTDQLKKPDPDPEPMTIKVAPVNTEFPDLETMVRMEVDRIIRSTIQENIHNMIKGVLVQEVEKAVAREIETLKRK